MNVFHTNRRGILLFNCSLYLSSKCVGKFGGNDVVDVWLIEGVGGSKRVSGRDVGVFSDVGVDSKLSDGVFGVFFFVRQIVMVGEDFEWHYWKDPKDLVLVMRVY